jgi:hypothetical protein
MADYETCFYVALRWSFVPFGIGYLMGLSVGREMR